jgi:DNA polymerase-4
VRKIIHIDMDAFFASVEQRDHPELRGRPVAVGGSRQRGVVAAASYEARRFGVRSAMPSVTARRQCPGLVFVRPRFEAYQAVSRQIHAIFHRYTDRVEPLSLDEAYLDVTENKPGIERATEIAGRIRAAIRAETGLTASAGVSYNKFLAKMASEVNKPDGLFVIPPQRAQAFIDGLPIGRFHGVGKATAARMKRLGIETGRDLRACPLERLLLHFGKAGHFFHGVARGIDERPVRVERRRKSLGAESTFEQDLTRLEDLLERLDAIAVEVAARLERQGLLGRTVTLKIKFADFSQITRAETGPAAIGEAAALKAVAHRLMRRNHRPGMRIRLLGLALSRLEAATQSATDAGVQLDLGI